MNQSKIFIVIAAMMMATACKQNLNHSERPDDIRRAIQSDIDNTSRTIDSLRICMRYCADAKTNPIRQYLDTNADHIDSLRNKNRQLFHDARRAAIGHYVIVYVPNDETVFSEFRNVPAVRRIAQEYFANKETIRQYDVAVDAYKTISNTIRHTHDSVLVANMDVARARMDSLRMMMHSLDVQNIK